jgi:hypothetical protein
LNREAAVLRLDCLRRSQSHLRAACPTGD